MPYYYANEGIHSHRHPFYGYGQAIEQPPTVPATEPVSPVAPETIAKVGLAAVAGVGILGLAVTGGVIYLIYKLVKKR